MIRALSPNIFDKRNIKGETGVVVLYSNSEECHPIDSITIWISIQLHTILQIHIKQLESDDRNRNKMTELIYDKIV